MMNQKISLNQLYHSGRLGLLELLAKFTVNPAGLLKLDKGNLSQGADADVTVFDPDLKWAYNESSDAGKSSNSPFNGWQLRGRATMTMVAGKIVWRHEPVAA